MTTAEHTTTPPIVQAGAPLNKATAALILLHGRGSNAQDILQLGRALADDKFVLLAPQAPNSTWYPNSFLAPRQQNEPYLSSALAQVDAALKLAASAGLPASAIAFCGFSQGACLASEFVGRNPQRYRALLAFTGGLIGPLSEPITLTGDLAGTPILLSSGDPDAHVPWQRVQQSGELLTGIGGKVTLHRYPGRSHTVLPQEVETAKQLLHVDENK